MDWILKVVLGPGSAKGAKEPRKPRGGQGAKHPLGTGVSSQQWQQTGELVDCLLLPESGVRGRGGVSLSLFPLPFSFLHLSRLPGSPIEMESCLLALQSVHAVLRLDLSLAEI